MNKKLLILNLFILLSFVIISFNQKASFSLIETEKILIKDLKSSSYIEMSINDQIPVISIVGKNKSKQIEIIGGEEPKVSFLSNKKEPLVSVGIQKGVPTIHLKQEKKDRCIKIKADNSLGVYLLGPKQAVATQLSLNEKDEADLLFFHQSAQRLQLHGGQTPGVFLKSPLQQTIGSLTVLKDGGGGLGLAESNGIASTILRGGESPSIAFFSRQSEPSAALGVLKKVPHLLISGNITNEGILIHGGQPSGMMVIDEKGKLKIFISKHGVFQGKEAPVEQQQEERPKYFSWDEEDYSKLFPEGKKY